LHLKNDLPRPWHWIGTLSEPQGVHAVVVAYFDDFHPVFIPSSAHSQPPTRAHLIEANPLANCTSLARQDLFDLLQVIDVVPGKHAHDVFDRFLPPFGMHSVVLPLLGLERLKQRKILFPQHAKLLNRFPRIALVVMSAYYPFVLIVGHNG